MFDSLYLLRPQPQMPGSCRRLFWWSFLCLECDRDVPTSPPPSVSISVLLLSALACFLATPSSAEFVCFYILAILPRLLLLFLCLVLPALFPLLPPPLYVSSCIPQHRPCRCICGSLYIPHCSTLFRTHFLFKSSICQK